MIKARTKQVLGFNDLWFMVIGICLASFALPVMIAGKGLTIDSEMFFRMAVVSFGFTLFYWFVLRQVVIFLRTRFPAFPETPKRLVIQTGFVLVLTFVVNLTCKPYIRKYVVQMYEGDHDGKQTFPIFLISLLLCFTVLGIYETIYMLQQWKNTALEAEKLRKETAIAQFDSLKTQVNPHFLFNSLNTLTSIVHEDPDLSVEFIRKLSTTYRFLLEIRNHELIPLSEEMECAQAYLFLLQTRFGESLQVEVDIEPAAMGQYIVPLSLQMLLENAIKHNVVSRKKPLRITISAPQADAITVSNNVQPRLEVEPSTGTGLANIRSRYAYVSRREVLLSAGSKHFEVVLPLLTVKSHADSHH